MPTGPAGMAALATRSSALVLVIEAGGADGGAELVACKVVVAKWVGVCDRDRYVFSVDSLICSCEICEAGVGVGVGVDVLVWAVYDVPEGRELVGSFSSMSGEEYWVCASTICGRREDVSCS